MKYRNIRWVSYSLGGSSDAAVRCLHCSNLLYDISVVVASRTKVPELASTRPKHSHGPTLSCSFLRLISFHLFPRFLISSYVSKQPHEIQLEGLGERCKITWWCSPRQPFFWNLVHLYSWAETANPGVLASDRQSDRIFNFSVSFLRVHVTADPHDRNIVTGLNLQTLRIAVYAYHQHLGWRRGVAVSVVRQWTKLTHVGPGYNWDGWQSSGGYTISGCNKPTRSIPPCIPPGSLNRVLASAGVKAGMSPLPGGR